MNHWFLEDLTTIHTAGVHQEDTGACAKGTISQCPQSSHTSRWSCGSRVISVDKPCFTPYQRNTVVLEWSIYCISSPVLWVAPCLCVSQEKGLFSFCWWLLFPQGSELCLCIWDKGCTRVHTIFRVPLLSSPTPSTHTALTPVSLGSILLGWTFMCCSDCHNSVILIWLKAFGLEEESHLAHPFHDPHFRHMRIIVSNREKY